MIKFAASQADPQIIAESYPARSRERNIMELLISSQSVIHFEDPDELKFEISMRVRILDASVDLYKGRLRFRTFKESFCNERFWTRMDNGGFMLKDGILPSDGIKDIFTNTKEYGTECATAIVIIYYKAVLDVYSAELFNSTFGSIILMNWLNMSPKLGVVTHRSPPVYLPGDCRYFKNPDVNPLTPEWQGENAIFFENDNYYGHGIGMVTGDMIIKILNSNRFEGAEQSAYLLETATRPDFKGLWRIKKAQHN